MWSRCHPPAPPKFTREEMSLYTLGPALRIPDIKNMGKDLAPEELRICPRLMGGPPATTHCTWLSLITWCAHWCLSGPPTGADGVTAKKAVSPSAKELSRQKAFFDGGRRRRSGGSSIARRRKTVARRRTAAGHREGASRYMYGAGSQQPLRLRICPCGAVEAKNVGRAQIPVFLTPGQECSLDECP